MTHVEVSRTKIQIKNNYKILTLKLWREKSVKQKFKWKSNYNILTCKIWEETHLKLPLQGKIRIRIRIRIKIKWIQNPALNGIVKLFQDKPAICDKSGPLKKGCIILNRI